MKDFWKILTFRTPDKYCKILNIFSLIFIVLGICLWILLLYNSRTVESFYFDILFQSYRNVWKYVIEFSPVPLLYVWIFICLAIFILIFNRYIKRRISFAEFVFSVLLFLLGLIAYFYIAWGFNYLRPGLSKRLELNKSIEKYEFIEEFLKVSREVSSCYTNSLAFRSSKTEKQLNDEIAELISGFLQKWRLPLNRNVRCRFLQPKGCLLIWSTAGIYWPFAGESQIDAGLHPLEWPFTMAHELAHGMGWTNEGECNFIAYEACSSSSNPNIVYSAKLVYWKYLMNSLVPADSIVWKNAKDLVIPEVWRDIESIHLEHQKYPSLLPELRDWIYNAFLKFNKVPSGVNSYDEIIPLVIQFENK